MRQTAQLRRFFRVSIKLRPSNQTEENSRAVT
jgi:hypothetical protein